MRKILLFIMICCTGGAGMAQENFVYPAEIAGWTQQEKERQAADTVKMLDELLKAARSGAKSYTIHPGNYRFGQQEGYAKCLYLYRINDFVIEAEGVTFWIDATFRQDAVVLKECSNVTIRGLTIDCDPFSYSQGEIIEIDRQEKYLTVKLDPGFPPLETWRAGGNMKAPFFDREGNFAADWLDYVASYEKQAEGIYRIRLKNNYIFTYGTPIEPGYRMAFPDRSKRMAFNLLNSGNCTLENITVYNAPQMAFTEHGGAGGHRYLNCNVIRRPGTRRLITCNADLFHSIKTEKGPRIENCDWGWSCDDLINIHGFFSYVVKPLSDREFLVVQSQSPEAWQGTEIELYNDSDMKFIDRVKVVEMTPVTDDAEIKAAGKMPEELRNQGINTGNFLGGVFLFRVKTDRPVKVKRHDLIQSYRYAGSGTLIRNNRLHDTLARGMLVRGDGAMIENNRIENTGYNAIQVLTDWYFMEGMTARNMTIRNNEIINCANGLHGRLMYSLHNSAINLIVCHRNWEFARGISPIRNILIENNRVVDSGAAGIAVGNATDVKVRNNVIVNPYAKGLHPRMNDRLRQVAAGIYVVESEHVELSDNRIEQLKTGVSPIIDNSK